MHDDSRVINRVFSAQVLDNLLFKGHSDVFDYAANRYVPKCEQKTVGEVFGERFSNERHNQRL